MSDVHPDRSAMARRHGGREALLAACADAGVNADFDLQEVDEDGDPVGDEHHIG